MTKFIITFLAFCFFSHTIFSQLSNQNKADEILGEWMNTQKDAKFLIYKNNNNYLGKIIWGTGSQTKDIYNPDTKLRNRELIGLTILNDFMFSGDNTWEEGTIYDPKNGKTYSCKLTLESSSKLNVRGYIGISLFGRTETWTRIK